MTAINQGTHDQLIRGLRDICSGVKDDLAVIAHPYAPVLKPPDCKNLTDWISYLISLEFILIEYKNCTGMVNADGRVFVKGDKNEPAKG